MKQEPNKFSQYEEEKSLIIQPLIQGALMCIHMNPNHINSVYLKSCKINKNFNLHILYIYIIYLHCIKFLHM